MTPRVTVLMPVFNAESTVHAAVRGILDQTFQDLELLVVDDGSTDGTAGILARFDDARVLVVRQDNRGVSAALDAGMQRARGAYIARQDADDVSDPRRLERQVAALDSDAGLGLIGCNYRIVDETGRELAVTDVFCHPEDVKAALVVSNQFGHGTVMFRRDLAERVGGYRALAGHERSFVEDLDLWQRISRISRVANLSAALYTWRRDPGGVTLSNHAAQLEQARQLREQEFDWLRAHRGEFKILGSFHPGDFRGGPVAYLEKKSALLRGFALLYRASGERAAAARLQLAATLLAPWRRRNWRRLRSLVRPRRPELVWEFEYV
jgi:glycosyltransferase involved in cell wall biosynthesis